MADSNNFWNQSEPLFCLAPMEDVTDTVFREILLANSSYKGLKVLFTEFLSTDGFCHPIGRDKVLHRFKVNNSELKLLKDKGVKLVAQIWGANPIKFKETAKYISSETVFDGIDINMGCPQKNIIKKGACSALIKNRQLALEIIKATIESTHLPVSVKTRIGFEKVETESWLTELLKYPIKALTVHGRIQKQMSDGVADWNEIAKAKELGRSINPEVVVIGNGDVISIKDGLQKIKETKVDGVMVGRGVFNNFWMFNEEEQLLSPNEKIEVLCAHAQLYNKTWGGEKPWGILKRFFKIYTYNIPKAATFRNMLMQTNSLKDLDNVIQQYYDIAP